VHGLAVRSTNLRPGLRLGPHWGSLQRSPRPLSWFKEDLLLRRDEGKGRDKEGRQRGEGTGGRGWGGKERKGKESRNTPPLIPAYTADCGSVMRRIN